MFRGQDSTGISVAYRPEGEEKRKLKSDVAFHHKKTLESAPDFFNNNESCKPLDHKNLLSIMGHTRAATLGDVVVKNAHPHWYKHIIGTHNGTIPMLNRSDEQKKLGSDSVNLFRLIANEGLVPVLKDIGVRGAYALAYYDTSDLTLNFIRNDQRTLYYLYTKGKTTMYWASERRMLEFIRATAFDFDEVRPFLTGVHYKIKIGMPRIMEETELQLRPLEFLRRGSTTNTARDGTGSGKNISVWDHETQRLIPKQEYLELKRSRLETMSVGDLINRVNAECDEIQRMEQAEKQVLLPPAKHHVPQVGWSRDYQVSKTVILSIEEAQARLADGCTNCRSEATVDDDTYWLNSSEWFCEDCKDQEFVKEYIDTQRLTKGKIIHIHTVQD